MSNIKVANINHRILIKEWKILIIYLKNFQFNDSKKDTALKLHLVE